MADKMISRLTAVISAQAAAATPLDTARALLTVMREPDGGMIDYGAENVPGNDPANHREAALDIWRGMIDIALDELAAERRAPPRT